MYAYVTIGYRMQFQAEALALAGGFKGSADTQQAMEHLHSHLPTTPPLPNIAFDSWITSVGILLSLTPLFPLLATINPVILPLRLVS